MSPRIWAVGGGKGGVGKSLITSSLGILLARRARRTVVIDADLGGANLHTLLGVTTPRRTLSDFVGRRVGSLAEVMTPTHTPGLWLISGSRALMDAANPKHTQKEKILRHVKALDVEHVLLDLGAGSAFNVLDFFLAAQRGILVVVPEPTSIENAYHFLKAAFYRKLKTAAKRTSVREVITEAFEGREKKGIRSPKALLAEVARIDPEVGAQLAEVAAGFTPQVVVNQVRSHEHHRLGPDIRAASRAYFGTDIGFLGTVPHDEAALQAVRSRRPILEQAPTSEFARAVEQLAERLLAGKEADDVG